MAARYLSMMAAGLAVGLLAGPAFSQREIVARGVVEARQQGDEATLVHLAERIGPAGVAECLEHAGRAGRMICAQAGRYLEHPWPVLPVLVTVLGDHDRQVASRAAESMQLILSDLEPEDLGPQEVLPEEVEGLLEGLGELVSSRHISPDIRAQAVVIFGALTRLVGAGLEVPRRAIDDPEVAVRRAAVAALSGSTEADDVSALSGAVRDRDIVVSTQAVAGVCEVTIGAGRAMPSAAEARLRELLADESLRPAVMLPILVCLARSRAAELRALAERHPNEATRQAWQRLVEGQTR